MSHVVIALFGVLLTLLTCLSFFLRPFIEDFATTAAFFPAGTEAWGAPLAYELPTAAALQHPGLALHQQLQVLLPPVLSYTVNCCIKGCLLIFTCTHDLCCRYHLICWHKYRVSELQAWLG